MDNFRLFIEWLAMAFFSAIVAKSCISLLEREKLAGFKLNSFERSFRVI
jgi:hypothetical protein